MFWVSLKSLTDHQLGTVASGAFSLCAFAGSEWFCPYCTLYSNWSVKWLLLTTDHSHLFPCHVIYSKSNKMYKCSKNSLECLLGWQTIFLRKFCSTLFNIDDSSIDYLMCVANMVSSKGEISILTWADWSLKTVCWVQSELSSPNKYPTGWTRLVCMQL